MNRKGFTLIELLAVIVILGIILVIAAPNISNAYKNSKLKSEEIFIDRLSDTIDTYITLNSDDLSFSEPIIAQKSENNEVYDVKVYSSTIQINDIITSGIISEKDFVNPGNKNISCNNVTVYVYKDSDHVFCHRIKKDELNCLTEEYKASITDDYVIDTCTWRKPA